MVNEFPLKKSFLQGESTFLTGGTGFVGKAILELLIRDHFPHVKYMYCLVRGRKGQTVQERLINDVMSNKIFNVIKDKIGPERWQNEVISKLVAIEGDISLDGLGISASDLELLQRDLGVVIHCAATVDFNERLDRSLTLNTLGTLQMLNLCDSCPNMKGFVHVSTGYVNSNRKEETIHERIYPMVFGEPKQLVSDIQKMDLPQIESFTEEILKVYPNTYTFTKSLAENMAVEQAEMMKEREIKTGKPAWSLAIVRPTVVTSTAADPVPGWVDGVSAANGIAMYIGIGVMDSFPGNKDVVSDLVPVDYLANVVLRACADFRPPGTKFVSCLADPTKTVRTLTPDLNIDKDQEVYPRVYHAASSALNPISWGQFALITISGWEKLPPLKKRVFPPAYHTFSSNDEFNTVNELRQQYKFSTVAMLTSLTDPKKGAKLRSFQKKLDFLYHCFKHFMCNGWSFQSHNVQRMEKRQENRKDILTSNVDSKAIQKMPWDYYIYFFIYGMYYFVLNESNSIRPHMITQGWECVLNKRPQLISPDMVQNQGDKNHDPYDTILNPWKMKHMHTLRKSFIHHPNVKQSITTVAKSVNKSDSELQQALTRQVVEAESLLGMMNDDPEGRKTLHRWFTSGLDSIHVNRSKALKLLDTVSNHPNSRVIYLPTHHSNLDFAVLCHVLNQYGLPTPLISSEGEGKLMGYLARDNIMLAKSIFKDFSDDSKVRSSMAKAYLQLMLENKGTISLFVDGPPHETDYTRRSEQVPPHLSNLISKLQDGEASLLGDSDGTDFLMELLKELKNSSNINPDEIILAPVSISYERGLDQSQLVKRWSGEDEGKPLKVACIEPDGGKGRVHIAFANSITLNQLFSQCNQMKETGIEDPSLIHPTTTVRNNQLQCQVISPVALVAMILSGHRQGITFNAARTLLVKLRREVKSIGYNCDWQDEEDATAVLSYSLEVIGPDHVSVEMGLSDSHASKAGPTPNQVKMIKFNDNEISSLRLSSLISQIQHVFIFDALFACTYHWCHQKASKTDVGVPSLNLIKKCYGFLSSLIQHQYPELQIQGFQRDFSTVVKQLEARDFIEVMNVDNKQSSDGPVVVLNNDFATQDYLQCSMAILNPTLDAAWATCCALSLLPSLGSFPVPQFLSLVQSNLREMNQTPKSLESCSLPTLYHVLAGLVGFGLLDIDISKDQHTLKIPSQLKLALSLSDFMKPWRELPKSPPDSHNSPNSNPEHTQYLTVIEQIGCAIDAFRSTSHHPSLPPFVPSGLPQLPSPSNPDPSLLDPSNNLTSSPDHNTPNLSRSVIQNWGHYLTQLLSKSTTTGGNKVNSVTNANRPSSPNHTRGDSR